MPSVPSNVPMDDSAAGIVVCFIIKDDNKLPSLTVPLACGDVSWLITVMLEVQRTLFESSHREVP